MLVTNPEDPGLIRFSKKKKKKKMLVTRIIKVKNIFFFLNLSNFFIGKLSF